MRIECCYSATQLSSYQKRNIILLCSAHPITILIWRKITSSYKFVCYRHRIMQFLLCHKINIHITNNVQYFLSINNEKLAGQIICQLTLKQRTLSTMPGCTYQQYFTVTFNKTCTIIIKETFPTKTGTFMSARSCFIIPLWIGSISQNSHYVSMSTKIGLVWNEIFTPMNPHPLADIQY